MSMTDPIADLLTRIRNGQTAGKPEVHIDSSQGEDGDRQGPEGRRLHRGLPPEAEGGKPTLTIGLKYYEAGRSSTASSASAVLVCASIAARTSCRKSWAAWAR